MSVTSNFEKVYRSGARALAVFLLLVVSCQPAGDPDDVSGRFSVVTTVGMITDIVQNVAGDRANVRGLLGEGVDPHLYKPSRTDIAALLKADVVFYNGLLLEGKMTDALIKAANSGKRVHAVTELLDEGYLLEPPGLEGHVDPHVWMDPVAWKEAVVVVRDKLAEFDPAGRERYEENARRYLAELDRLHDYGRRIVATVPADHRVLITAHDAFNYFGRRYGFEVRGIQGLSTESEAGVRDIEELVTLLVERGIRAVFVESTVADRNVRALILGAGKQGHVVKIGGTLFSDAMGPPGSYEGTYVGMIDHNLTQVVRALGGEAPPRGLQDLLTAEIQSR